MPAAARLVARRPDAGNQAERDLSAVNEAFGRERVGRLRAVGEGRTITEIDLEVASVFDWIGGLPTRR